MKPMVWKPEYSIHDAKVDAQHRHLFELYNQISSVPTGSIDRDRLIHELYNYAVFHFAEEEALMATARYPDHLRKDHERVHRSFFNTLERLRSQSIETALEFFRGWLVRHILTEDKDIGQYLEALPAPEAEQAHKE